MDEQDVWLLTGTEAALRRAAQASPGDVVLRDCGDVLCVGRVVDGLYIEWGEEIDADLLPERTVEHPPAGATQRVDDAPALFAALARRGEAPELGAV